MHIHDLALRLARHRGIVLSAARTGSGWRLIVLRPSLPRAERVALSELGAHLGLAAAAAALVAAARPWATKTGDLRGGIAEDASVDWAALDAQNRAGETVEFQKASPL